MRSRSELTPVIMSLLIILAVSIVLSEMRLRRQERWIGVVMTESAYLDCQAYCNAKR